MAASASRLNAAETDDEPVRSASSPQPEGNLQRMCLRFRERVPRSEHRRAQLMQRGERQLELRLKARDLRDPALSGPAGAIPEQRGFRRFPPLRE